MRALEAITAKGETSALCQSIGVSRASLYRRRWTFAGISGSGAVAADVVVGPPTPVALQAPSAFGPTTTSISTAGGRGCPTDC